MEALCERKPFFVGPLLEVSNEIARGVALPLIQETVGSSAPRRLVSAPSRPRSQSPRTFDHFPPTTHILGWVDTT